MPSFTALLEGWGAPAILDDMDPRLYRFSRTFALAAPREEVHSVLVDLEHYSGWWPQVRAVARLDDDRALVVARAALPYSMELELTAVDRSLERLEVSIDGPITGWARFDLTEPAPGCTRLLYEQEVCARGRLLAAASYVARPVLAWNHQRMMAGAERGLRARFQPRAESTAS